MARASVLRVRLPLPISFWRSQRCSQHIGVYYTLERLVEITGTEAMNQCHGQLLRGRGAATALFIVFTLFAFRATAGSAEPGKLDAFAKCLAEKKAAMYGSFLCPHCDDQKNLFGKSFQYVPYVECSVRGRRQMTFPCIAAQIRYTPTWIFEDGERLVGLQSLKSLSEKTGCPLP